MGIMKSQGWLFSLLMLLNCLLASTLIGQQVDGRASPADYPQLGGLNAADQAVPLPLVPEEFRNLTPEHQKYIEDLLDVWEQSSSQVKLCTCDFERWDYNAEIVSKRDPNDNRLIAHRIVRGQIRFGNPDQAQYESSEMWSYQNPDEQNPYVQQKGDGDHEKWICDGKSIYEFDFVNKRVYENKIPSEMQGSGLAESPLPFLFGAKKQQILDRYWLRIATPAGLENEYWLLAVPKRAEDAQTYSKVEIILAKEDFLPKSLHIYSKGYNPATTAVSQHVEFKNRKINGQLATIKNFMGMFVRPAKPIGWEWVEGLPEAGRPASADSNSSTQFRSGAANQPSQLNRK